MTFQFDALTSPFMICSSSRKSQAKTQVMFKAKTFSTEFITRASWDSCATCLCDSGTLSAPYSGGIIPEMMMMACTSVSWTRILILATCRNTNPEFIKKSYLGWVLSIFHKIWSLTDWFSHTERPSSSWLPSSFSSIWCILYYNTIIMKILGFVFVAEKLHYYNSFLVSQYSISSFINITSSRIKMGFWTNYKA